MIQFTANVYDATDGAILATNETFTLGLYSGTELDSAQRDVVITSSGFDVTKLSYDDRNVGRRLCEYSLRTYEAETGNYHAIRVCTTSSPVNMFFEYDRNNGINQMVLKAGNVSVMVNSLIFRDDLGDHEWGVSSYVFTNATTISQISPMSETPGIYFGCYRRVSNSLILVQDNFQLLATSLEPLSGNNDLVFFGYYGSIGHMADRYWVATHGSEYYAVCYLYGPGGAYNRYSSYILVFSAEPFTVNWISGRYPDATTYSHAQNSTSDSRLGNYVLLASTYNVISEESYSMNSAVPFVVLNENTPIPSAFIDFCCEEYDIVYMGTAGIREPIYVILSQPYSPMEGEPPSDVDPDDPDAPTPPPPEPDDPDPYYDPTSDPDSPEYDPTKDPESPEYDPSEPHTPYRPPSGPSEPVVEEEHPPQDPIPTPETPPSYVTTNAMFTLYNPSGGDLTNLANFLWSPTWSIDTFKKIFANPLDCILGLMVMPHLNAPVDTKVMNVGNVSTGVTMHYFTKQFYDFDCGTFEVLEYYNSYLDYAPYTKVNIYLPYIGDKQLSTDEVMNKTLGVKYRFDLATGDCVAFITVDGSVLYSFSGNCAARLPLAGNNWNGIIPAITGVAISAGSMAAGLPALGAASAAAVSTMKETISHTGSISGSAGLMGIQTPYLIITRPRQALPLNQNSFTGYPSFITESLGSLSGYTEVEQCHLEHVPCTASELEEIERLLKGGVLF